MKAGAGRGLSSAGHLPLGGLWDASRSLIDCFTVAE